MQHIYYVNARWRDREESQAESARRLADFVRCLAHTSRIFTRVFEEPRLAKDAFKREIAVSPAALERLLLLGRSWDGEGGVIDRMGSHTTFWTAAYPGGEFCRFSVTCGARDDLDIGHQIGRVHPRIRDASFDAAACHANLVQDFPVRRHDRIVGFAPQHIDRPAGLIAVAGLILSIVAGPPSP